MVDPLNFDPKQQNKISFRTHILEFIETLVVFAAIAIVIYWQVAQPHKVSGCSMCPNFHTGDYIITNKIGYRFSPPQRGQVIVFENPRDNSQDFIKRIIGLPGDRVKVQGGRVFINGQILNEPYLEKGTQTNPGAFLHEGEEVTVPSEEFIVLGDNRGFSSDSREWGFITRDEIVGVAFFRYWLGSREGNIGFIPSANY